MTSIREKLRRSPAVARIRQRYWRTRFRLLRSLLPSCKRSPDGLPVPPEELRFLISGIPSYPVGDFMDMGRLCVQRIQEALRKHGTDLAHKKAILDFGCGCGRTIRYLAHLQDARLHGSDYNPVLVGWCRPNLAFAQFALNRLEPPLVYDDRSFDLVYSFSVFTHLPEDLQHRWMRELTRVLKPGGHLVLSTMPERLLPAESVSRFRSGELVVVNADAAGSNACGVFHPYAYMEKTLAPHMEILEYTPEAVGQDLWLLRNPALS